MTISTYFPEPYGLKFEAWGAIVAEQLSSFGIAAPINEDGWKTWVSALFQVPELVSMNIPVADNFDDWSAWAEQFIGSVR